MKKVLQIVFVLLFIAAIGGTMYFLYAKSQEKPVEYLTDEPYTADIIKKTVATGSIIPRQEIEIKPQVSGIIDELYVEPGEIVEKGQLLAKIRIIPNMQQLTNAESQVETARITFENAEKELNRQEALYNQGIIPEIEYNGFLMDYKLAKENYQAAKDNLQVIKEGATNKTTNATNLVKSTTAGMILDIPVEEGTSVIESNSFNDGTTVMSVADMGDMIFQGDVDESEVGKISEGMALDISIGAIEGLRFDGILEYIAPKGVLKDGAIQFEIKASVQLVESAFVRANYSANANIVLERRDSVLAIKESLVQFDDEGKTYVMIETSAQEFERRDVELGLSDGIQVEVLDGLKEADKIKIMESYGEREVGG